MAEEGDEGFGNEIPENSDYILFAEDLVNYVMLKISQNYSVESDPIKFRSLTYNPFDSIIKRSIKDILSFVEANNLDFVQYIRDNLNNSSDSYKSLAHDIEQDDFERGFNARRFLIHCTTISFIAALFYNSGVDTAPDLAKFHIINVLKYRRPPSCGWNVIRRIAKIIPIGDELWSEID